MDGLLRIRNLSVSYLVNNVRSLAVDGVSLEIGEGEIVGLVGESGSGKSTLAHTIMRTIRPPGFITGGEVLFNGKDLLKMGKDELRGVRWKEISLVPQASQNALSPTKRVRDHFVDTMRAHGITDRRVVEESATHYLEEVLLEPKRVLNAYPIELSGGMKQRVLIALSLMLNPRLVVFDEPTSALDVITQLTVLELIREVQRKTKISILFITHDISIIAGFAQRVAVMYSGKVMELGDTDEILRAASNPYSIALLRAVPKLHGNIDGVRSIQGNPSDSKSIGGCRFHTRCEYAQGICSEVEPPFEHLGALHYSYCHFNGKLVPNNLQVSTLGSSHFAINGGPVPSNAQISTVGTSGSSQFAVEQPDLISVRNLNVVFNVRKGFSSLGVQALRDVNLTIGSSDLVVLVGESGSGKTTLGRVVAGLQKATSGSMEYEGTDLSKLKGGSYAKYRKSVNLVHQDPYTSLNPSLTVESSLVPTLMWWKIARNRKDAREQASQLLRTVGLSPNDTLPKYPHQLSGGQRQRIAIARAMSTNPRLLVLDEPVSMIDVSLRIGVLDTLLEIRDRLGTAFLFITHDLGLARYFIEKAGGGRILVMYRGTVMETGTSEQIVETPSNPYTKALLAATPSEDGLGHVPVTKLVRGEDELVSRGCLFSPRCAYSEAICETEEPKLLEVGQGQFSACHFAQKIRNNTK